MLTTVAASLTRALTRLGIPVYGVSIGDLGDRATWRVQYRPAATAQQRIDGDALALTYDPLTDTVYRDEVLDAEVKRAVDDERLISAVVWTVIDTYSAPATPTKYNAARTKILTAYKNRPWLA